MIDNMQKDTPKYSRRSPTMLKNNLMVFNTKKGNVSWCLISPAKNMDIPHAQTYAYGLRLCLHS